ncbi:Uncharacterised protein (plasmid) [Tsukamurella tyrosinosolvens]|uniref:Uncharacterized protein n=1 Tax=Tsukamurella tyrosinosolvens TaxID=57704 RepID=A0A1H4UUK2_TSUTY|nr:hypothetical protein [Tsukamurella tyrosinosolvens]KXO98387.1 hypothetical protein AXK58_25250 [Tsukamurella tyrosinosolvens]SEC72210.1 hypothetical protein SAMN04489793_3035 [Tsukamurella tyrosinosolvens]VEH90881.1 Uncharacterised protein [Tsukamurella tyrosinosolvens]
MTGGGAVQEFVVIDAADNEVDWIDPYTGHRELEPGLFVVSRGEVPGFPGQDYRVTLPAGGRFEIRRRE